MGKQIDVYKLQAECKPQTEIRLKMKTNGEATFFCRRR